MVYNVGHCSLPDIIGIESVSCCRGECQKQCLLVIIRFLFEEKENMKRRQTSQMIVSNNRDFIKYSMAESVRFGSPCDSKSYMSVFSEVRRGRLCQR